MVKRPLSSSRSALVTSLLEVARAEAGMPGEEREDVDLAALVRVLIDAFDAAHVGEVLDPGRPSAVRKKRFGLF